MSLLMAVLAAAALSVFGFPFVYYQCWYSWGRRPTVVLVAFYFVVAGGGGGLLGWAVGTASGAAPSSNILLDGLLFGLTGALALRADFGARKQGGDTAQSSGTATQASEAASILGAGLRWVESALDTKTRQKIEAWLAELPNDHLASEALRVQVHIEGRQDVNDEQKEGMSAALVPYIEQLNSSASGKAARAHLIFFCTDYFLTLHWIKPRQFSGVPVSP